MPALPTTDHLADDQYHIYCMRYAGAAERMASENFMVFPKDIHDGPMPVDYNIWILRNAKRTIVVDTGFGEQSATERHRRLDFDPLDGLRQIGIAPESVEHVIVTHLHFDHAGNVDRFPRARFYIQETEVAFATGPCMCHKYLRGPFRVDDVVSFVRKVYDERVTFLNGDASLFPGVELLVMPGHSQGLQSVLVGTENGPVLLASDAAHFYVTFVSAMPSRSTVDVAASLTTYRRLIDIAGDIDRIVPGHDPKVRELYPSIEINGITLSLLHAPQQERSREFFQQVSYVFDGSADRQSS